MNEVEYEKMYQAEDAHWWYVSLHNLILHFVSLEREKNGNLDIFDAGSGTGRLFQLMTKFGNVSGCDASELAVTFCNLREIFSIFKADLNLIDLGTERYNVITSLDVLCHSAIKDDNLVLKKFFDAIKPGGLLILSLPAYNLFKSHHDIAVHTERRYTKHALVNKLQDLGFKIDKASYRVGALFVPITVYRLFQKIFLTNKDEDELSSDVAMSSAILNTLLLKLNLIENFFIERFCMPFGTSVFIVARKPFDTF